MPQDIIFAETDPAFKAVILAVNELRKMKRLKVRHFQNASITNIQSNDDSDDKRFMFGGDSAFGRTASAVIRMCMLEAAGVKPGFWPTIGRNTAKRNKAELKTKQVIGAGPLPLGKSKQKAREYWCKYDQLYPHFLIEDEVRKVEIDKEFTAKPKGDQVFESSVHVSYIVQDIQPGKDGKDVKQLKEFMSPAKIRDEYFQEVFKVKNETDVENLHLLLKEIKIEDEP
ncbi:hypothetical protein AWC38_SpisGene24274 [Stylophora pistillata]|uniref:Uncharacterized protein n=1 Tax=Stylophora pistillata TaxID=50429 RepID=A0A2B4R2K8_STYPI|nr:hypothetical protein AWC38_SpisGene24274 [Stylophora pistillata]